MIEKRGDVQWNSIGKIIAKRNPWITVDCRDFWCAKINQVHHDFYTRFRMRADMLSLFGMSLQCHFYACYRMGAVSKNKSSQILC